MNGEKIRKSPLVEAVCEFRLSEDTKWDLTGWNPTRGKEKFRRRPVTVASIPGHCGLLPDLIGSEQSAASMIISASFPKSFLRSSTVDGPASRAPRFQRASCPISNPGGPRRPEPWP
jgi:hypothetical protein